MQKSKIAFKGATVLIVLGTLLLGGCVLAPREAKNEKASLERAGEPYRQPFEKRALPELPAQPELRDVLHRASLANGDLEAAYYKWATAFHKIQQAGGYPNTPLSGGNAGHACTTALISDPSPPSHPATADARSVPDSVPPPLET
jgi:hypothetical protein